MQYKKAAIIAAFFVEVSKVVNQFAINTRYCSESIVRRANFSKSCFMPAESK